SPTKRGRHRRGCDRSGGRTRRDPRAIAWTSRDRDRPGASAMATTTGDVIVQKLLGWGVDTAFGLPGDGINGIFEALRKNRDKIRFIQVRHEEAAAFAACGYAKFTG